MSAQPKLQYRVPAQSTSQRTVRVVAKSESPSMQMPKQEQRVAPAPRYDFVGIAG
jgi:hypothetical protein